MRKSETRSSKACTLAFSEDSSIVNSADLKWII